MTKTPREPTAPTDPDRRGRIEETLLREIPEINLIGDDALRARVIDTWVTSLEGSSFDAISEIPGCGNPDQAPLKNHGQEAHIRGVALTALKLAEALATTMPDLEFDRDILLAGALCHDIGKPWEFDPVNRARWAENKASVGYPSVRHPVYGVHLCLNAGLPESVVHITGAHAKEGDLVQRSIEGTIVHWVDKAFWAVARSADLVEPQSQEPRGS